MTNPTDCVKMARNWLLARVESDKELDALYPPDKPLTVAHVEALAQEFDAAITDRGMEWVETLIAGRPYATPLVEWEHRELQPEHHDCIPWDDAKGVAQQ